MLDCNTLASGDADVINTTLQLILPCLGDLTILASITGERIPLTPNAPTMGEVDSTLAMELWNGLFVRKETPQDVREKIISVAKRTMMGAKAQKIAKDTGALVYWKDAEKSAAQITRDGQDLVKINEQLN
jgi:tripartite-type tricarboxylate transporter receptor subunit TctC